MWGGFVLKLNEKEVQKCSKQKCVILLGFWEINTTAYNKKHTSSQRKYKQEDDEFDKKKVIIS